MKILLRQLRDHYLVSRILLILFGPLKYVCTKMSMWITWHVRANGVTIAAQDYSVSFPRNIGLMYSSIMYWQGMDAYEPSTWRVIRAGTGRAAAFLDVGSNIGLYAVMAAKAKPDLLVDVFEPVPSLAAGNRKFHESNALSAERVHEVAVSDTVGTAKLSIPRYEGGAEAEPTASLSDNSALSPGATYTETTVPTTTLDAFLAAYERPDPLFIKVDVEGHEIHALRGAAETLKARRPWLVVEMLPDAGRNMEVWRYAIGLQYQVYGICREGLFQVQEGDLGPERGFTDFLFLPRERVPGGRSYLAFGELAIL